MSIDLIQIADELHGIPDSDFKIEFPCPVHGEFAASLSLIAPDKLVPACEHGCEPKALWHGLVKESATLARLWAEKKKKDGDVNAGVQPQPSDNARAAGVTAGGSANESQRKEEGAYKGASGPGADVKHDNEKSGFSQQPPRPETQKKIPRWKLANAIAYARHGMRVFPCHSIESDGYCSCGATACKSAGKHPRIKDWQILATCDEAEIHKWWQQWPDSNVGVACGQSSNLTVLDVDGDAGRGTLRALELEHGELPETPIAITGSGGAHYYFAFQRGPNNAVRFAPGLDIRTEGGLVVGVGSRNGKGSYEWEAAFTLGSSGLLPAAMPGWLVDAIVAGQNGKAGPNGKVMLPATQTMVEGAGRHNEIWRLGRSLRAQNFPSAAIKAAIREANASFAQPLDSGELDPLIEDIITRPDGRNFLPADQRNGAVVPAGNRRPAIIREKHDQAVITNAEYLARPEVIEKLGYRQSIALIIGAKHHGKTTNVRTLALSVMRGVPIWGRATVQGHVVYAASDDEVASSRNELLRMGWSERSDPLEFVRIDPDTDATPQEILDAIGEVAIENQSSLIILDMLFDFVGIRDELSYAGTRSAIGMVQRLADKTKCLVVGSHHTPKYLTEAHSAANAALGSQGVSARFSPIILIRKYTDNLFTVESTPTRDPRGEAIKPTRIAKNADGWIESTGEFKEWMKWEIYAERVLGLFEGGDPSRGYSAYEVGDKLEMDRSRASNVLYQLQKVGKLTREKHGRGYRYYLSNAGMFDREGGNWASDSTSNE